MKFLVLFLSSSLFASNVKTIEACGWLNLEKKTSKSKNLSFVLHNFDKDQRFILNNKNLTEDQRTEFTNVINEANALEIYPNACIEGDFKFINNSNITSTNNLSTLKAQPVELDEIEYLYREIK